MIAEGELDVLIFFWDPMETQPHDSDVKALLRIGLHGIYQWLANRATADFIMTSPYINDEYEALIPDYTDILNTIY
jgi:methylglyoxal synthase